MFTFSFNQIFNCAVNLFNSSNQFKILTFVFFALSILGVAVAVVCAVSKSKKQLSTDTLFVLYLIFYFCDVTLMLKSYSLKNLSGISVDIIHAVCILRFLILCFVYFLAWLTDCIRLKIILKEKPKKSLKNSNQKIKTPSAQNSQIALNEILLGGCECFDPSKKGGVDINVSYLLALINCFYKKDISLDDKLWLDELTLLVRQSYALGENDLKNLNLQLEKLIKKAVEYDVGA